MEAPFSCSVCNFSSKYKSSYTNHLKTKKHLANTGSTSNDNANGAGQVVPARAKVIYTTSERNMINFNVDGVQAGSYELIPELFDLEGLEDIIDTFVKKHVPGGKKKVITSVDENQLGTGTHHVYTNNDKNINMNITSSFLERFKLTVEDVSVEYYTRKNVIFIQYCIELTKEYLKV